MSPNHQANAWMLQGIRLLNESSTSSGLQEAIECFDRAIALRQALPLENDPWARFGLIAGWLNRADALARFGSAPHLEQALEASAQALAHLGRLPLGQHPAFRERFGTACISRGQILQRRNGPGAMSESRACFDRAIAALSSSAELTPRSVQLLAGAWTNRGLACLALGPAQPAEALTSARQALAILGPRDQSDPIDAEISLTARHLFCQAAGHLLTDPAQAADTHFSLALETSDVLEDGLQLADRWERTGRFATAAYRSALFHFGAWLYEEYQPHFLVEYLLEHVQAVDSRPDQSAGGSLRASARASLARAFQRLQDQAVRAASTPQLQTLIERLGEMRRAAEVLASLPDSGSPGIDRSPGLLHS